jgi:hypothetical protein
MMFLVRESASVIPTNTCAQTEREAVHRSTAYAAQEHSVEERIIEPNQDSAKAERDAVELLTAAGYRNPEARVVASAASVAQCEEHRHESSEVLVGGGSEGTIVARTVF